MTLDKLQAQRAARQLARDVYKATLKAPLKNHWGLAEQIRRAAISIPANIAEGYGLGTVKQFARSGRIALGSARELSEFLTLSVDVEVLTEAVGRPLVDDCERVIQLVVGLLRHLGSKGRRG